MKVVDQTINFKDDLVCSPLHSVNNNNPREVYGDSSVLGFVESEKFNALVGMSDLNKAKMTHVKAEAKVALTAGADQIKADVNAGIVRNKIKYQDND